MRTMVHRVIDSVSDSSSGGAVLAGGMSRRMGVDKATIVVGGETMLERCLTALGRAGLSPLTIVGGDSGNFPSDSAVHFHDEWPGEGPLGALITALDRTHAHVVVVIACDLVDPSPEEINRVRDLLAGHQAVVPVVDGREQWLHSVWRRDCRQALRAAFDRGVRAIREAVGGLDVLRVEVVDPTHYRDADTPEDLPPDCGRS